MDQLSSHFEPWRTCVGRYKQAVNMIPIPFLLQAHVHLSDISSFRMLVCVCLSSQAGVQSPGTVFRITPIVVHGATAGVPLPFHLGDTPRAPEENRLRHG